MSTTSDLLNGIASDLDAQGIANLDPTAGNVFFKELPPAPDNAVALTAYSSTDEPKVAASSVRVQFWFRGDVDNSLSCDDTADATFEFFQGREDFTYGSVHVVQALRISSIQLGADPQRRHERSDNYQFDLDLPLTAGRPF